MVVNLAVLISVPDNEIQIYDVNALMCPDMPYGCLYSLERSDSKYAIPPKSGDAS